MLDVSQDGQVQASIERGPTDGYQHRSYTFTPDGQTIISGGGNGNLTAYDLKGKRIGKFRRPRRRRVGRDALARRPPAGLGQRRPDHPPVEPARRAS